MAKKHRKSDLHEKPFSSSQKTKNRVVYNRQAFKQRSPYSNQMPVEKTQTHTVVSVGLGTVLTVYTPPRPLSWNHAAVLQLLPPSAPLGDVCGAMQGLNLPFCLPHCRWRWFLLREMSVDLSRGLIFPPLPRRSGWRCSSSPARVVSVKLSMKPFLLPLLSGSRHAPIP